MLEIKNLHVSAENNSILKGVSLTVKKGEVHALMGQNGSGKSTLANCIAGHPFYTITKGSISFNKKNINKLAPNERAALGIYLTFQNPPTLPGVKISSYLRTAKNALAEARHESPTELTDYLRELKTTMKFLGLPLKFANRSLNEGFSGGEKKKLEILQALMLKPKLIILDEIDSGLDIDAIKVVAAGVKKLQAQGATIIIITHYQRILNFIAPNYVHILQQGVIAVSGDKSLVERLEKTSFKEVTTTHE